MWAAAVDFESRTKWSPRVKEAKVLDTGHLRPGSRIKLKIDGNSMTPVVTAIQPPERLALEVRGPGFRGSHVYTVRQAGANTEAAIKASYGGPLGAFFSRFMTKSIRRDLTDELDAIKKAAEAR